MSSETAGFKQANTISWGFFQSEWLRKVQDLDNLKETERRLKSNRYWIVSCLPLLLHSAPPCTPEGWSLERVSPGSPCPLASSCALPLGGTYERLEDRKKGRQGIYSSPILPTSSVPLLHCSFTSSFCTDSHSCSFTPKHGSPFQILLVPSALLSLPWCPNPSHPSINDIFTKLSSITHFECVICFLLGL